MPKNPSDIKIIQAEAARVSASFPQLIIDAERVALTVEQGFHGRRRVGQGESFWQYRPFDTGDGSGGVDWRRSAKSDQLYIRETEWETAQSVWIWRDSSPSMDFSSAPDLPRKSRRADLVCLALALMLQRSGERFGLIGAQGKARAGHAGLREFCEQLSQRTAAGGALPSACRLAKYSEVVLAGDFLLPVGALKKLFVSFAERQLRGHIVQILDPAEETLPYQGRIHFLGMENEGDMLVQKVQNLREKYQRRLKAHRQTLIDLARRYGWEIFIHHTNRPPETVLMALFTALGERRRPDSGRRA